MKFYQLLLNGSTWLLLYKIYRPLFQVFCRYVLNVAHKVAISLFLLFMNCSALLVSCLTMFCKILWALYNKNGTSEAPVGIAPAGGAAPNAPFFLHPIPCNDVQ